MKKLVGGLLMAISMSALADGQAVIQAEAPEDGDQTSMNISWVGNDLRMDYPDQQAGYMLLQDGKGYMVSENEGQKIIMDLSMLKDLAESMSGEQANAASARSLESLEATGETETIAGIKGEVYQIQWTDNGDNTHNETIVLSDNPQARELLNAFHSFQKSLMGEPDPIALALEERGMGMLRQGDSFLIDSISDDIPNANLFTLPEDGVTFEEMMRKAMQEGASE